MKLQVLKISDFPDDEIFEHLAKGSEFYRKRDFQRAIEEWIPASTISFMNPVDLERDEGKICFGASLGEVPLLLLLYVVYSEEATGVGVLKGDNSSDTFLFRNGLLISALSTDIKKRIGNIIRRRSSDITSERMEELGKEAKIEKKRLGEHLVEKGLLSRRELQDVLRLQGMEILSHSLSRRKGKFYFVEGPVRKRALIKYSPIKMALLAAQRGINEATFRREIPNNKVIFWPSPYIDKLKEKIEEDLNTNEQFVLSLIDGFRNIDQLIAYSGAEENSIINILYRLSKLGLIRKTRESGEFEDKEFAELHLILKVLCEVYQVITEGLFHELGAKGKDLIEKARKNLPRDYQLAFVGVVLEEPEKIDINVILRNMASYFSSAKYQFTLMDTFYALYVNILNELNKFLGLGLTKGSLQEIRRIRNDIQVFSVKTELKQRLVEVLDDVVKRFG